MANAKPKIIIVDDDRETRELLALALQMEDFEVTQAACDLLRKWFVVRRRTSDRRQDVCVREMQTIIGSLRRGDIRKPRSVQS